MGIHVVKLNIAYCLPLLTMSDKWRWKDSFVSLWSFVSVWQKLTRHAVTNELKDLMWVFLNYTNYM